MYTVNFRIWDNDPREKQFSDFADARKFGEMLASTHPVVHVSLHNQTGRCLRRWYGSNVRR